MRRLHHVNLSIPVGGVDAEGAFLVDYLQFRKLEPTPSTPPGAKWFEGEDGVQIHLSEDPAHHPSERAHVALELGEYVAVLKDKFDSAGYEYIDYDGPAGRLLFCQDPAGNRWELRGAFPD
jgi:catechol 2,3-dioxygenase-like lactoylglutathione lyase family enzyme